MFFDYTDGDFCYGSGNILFDSDGDMMTRLSDSTAIDWETGDILLEISGGMMMTIIDFHLPI